MEKNAAESMLVKLRAFMKEELTPEERAALASLIAPGAALAYSPDEVQGYAAGAWRSPTLPEALVDAIRRVGLRNIDVDSET